jgi:hypothetical protein
MPHDLYFGDVYFPPLLAAAALGLIAASYTSRLMHKHGVMVRFANPPLVFIAFSVIYTVIFGSTIFPT